MDVRSKQACLVSRVALIVLVLPALSSELLAERLPIKTYTTTDGLARDSVNHILQDSRGFLWFCTSEALSRFDGYKFVNYGTESGLPGQQVTDFLEARNGYYWAATSRGLCRFIPDAMPGGAAGGPGDAPQRFLVYYPGGPPQSHYINAIYEDHTGAIWCCTELGLYRADQTGGDVALSLVDIIQPGTDPAVPFRVSTILEDRHGSMWIIAQSGVYRILPDGKVERFTASEGVPPGSDVLLEDRDGIIWMGSSQGLCQLVPDPKPNRPIVARRYTRKDGLASDDVSALCQSSDGTLWIGGSAGLTRFVRGRNGQAGRFQSYTEVNGLSRVNALREDREHNLWIGTLTAGAMRLAASGFVTYTDADGLGANHRTTNVASIFEDQAHELCVGGGYAPNLSISRFDGTSFSSVGLALPPGIKSACWGWYQVTFQDHTGEWWMPTGQGLVRYPRSTLEQISYAHPKAIYKTGDGLCADEVFRLFEDSRGDIWISTLGDANCVLTRWERATAAFHRFSPADGIPEHAPTAFGEDSAGNIWFGFYRGGLMRYGSGRFTPFPVGDGVPPGFVEGFYLDHAGRLWVATGEGAVCRIDRPADSRPSFVTYSTADGLSSNQADSITEDRWGMIYVGTGRGVDKLDPATGHIRHYTTADGLANNWVGVSFRDRNGSLWFGTLQGLSRLDPKPEPPASPPSILITAFNVAGNPYPISELGAASIAGPELPASQNNVQIEFAGLSFAAGESLRYQYMLEGTSPDWSAPGDQRVVTYPNLPPGSYRFLVRAVRSDGTPSESPAGASFAILRPIWLRWWFLLGAVSLVAIVGLAFAYSRIAHMRTERESDRRFRTLAETASDAIITIDEQGQIVLANQAAETIFGYSIGEMVGKELTMLMPEYLRELHRQGFARYKQTGVRHISWQAIALMGLHKSGSEIPLEISFGEFTKGERRFFTGIARDVTERKRAEEERKRAEADLRRSREERFAALEQVRKRIASDLHDDIGSSLTQISILSEVARQGADGGDSGEEPLAVIARSSRELIDSMSDIVWAINPERDHLSDLSQRMRRFASDLLTGRNIAFEFREPDEEDDVALGANVRRELFLIFKECINNLVRHSSCTEAEIDFQIGGRALNLRVADNGKGFDGSQDGEGHGLASMRQRAHGIGARLEIDSRPGSGTSISLELLLKDPQENVF